MSRPQTIQEAFSQMADRGGLSIDGLIAWYETGSIPEPSKPLSRIGGTLLGSLVGLGGPVAAVALHPGESSSATQQDNAASTYVMPELETSDQAAPTLDSNLEIADTTQGFKTNNISSRRTQIPNTDVSIVQPPKISIIGDSLTRAAEDALKRAFNERKTPVDIFAKGSMPLVNIACDNNVLADDCQKTLDGPRMMDIAKPLLADDEVVVIALGRNAPEKFWADTDPYFSVLERVVKEARQHTSVDDGVPAQIFVLDIASGQLDPSAKTAEARTKILHERAPELGVTVIPWRDVGLSRPELFLSDGVHLTQEGSTVFAELIAETVSAKRVQNGITEQFSNLEEPAVQQLIPTGTIDITQAYRDLFIENRGNPDAQTSITDTSDGKSQPPLNFIDTSQSFTIDISDILNSDTEAFVSLQPEKLWQKPTEQKAEYLEATPNEPIIGPISFGDVVQSPPDPNMLAETLGLNEINTYIIEQFKAGNSIDIGPVVEFYKARPDLSPPVDGVSSIPSPLVTENDYFTFSPNTCNAERRLSLEHVAYFKALTTYYNWITRHDERFIGLPASNIEAGDALSTPHNEHSLEEPALDIRTVLIGSPGGANNGPAFVPSSIKNTDLEEAIIRFAAYATYNGRPIVKYVIYGDEEVESRVADLYRANGKQFFIYKKDHPEHIHFALYNYDAAPQSIPDELAYQAPCPDGATNTSLDEVITFNNNWFAEVFQTEPLAPSESTLSELPILEAPLIEIDGVIDDIPAPDLIINLEPETNIKPNQENPTISETGSLDRVGAELAEDFEARIDILPIGQEEKDFLQLALPELQRAYNDSPANYAVNLPFIITQLTTESDWGRSKLAREANNFGGNKAPKDYTGLTVGVKDDEIGEDGQLKESRFIVFPSMYENFKYIIERYNELPAYADGVGCAEDAAGFGRGIKHHVAPDCVTIIANHDTDEGSENWQPGYATLDDYDIIVVDRLEKNALDTIFEA